MFSVNVYKPLPITLFNPLVSIGLNPIIAQLQDKVSTLQFKSKAFGGYDTATIAFNTNQIDLESWSSGLARHIEIYDNALNIMWEGFINIISMTIGQRQLRVGPLLDVGNTVRVTYTPKDFSVSPPATGSEILTSSASNIDSQALYGTIEKIIAGEGDATETEAENRRTSWLNSAAGPWPAVSKPDTPFGGGGGPPSVSLECLGYWHWLDTYYPIDTNSGTRTKTLKIQDILGAVPNSIFSIDYSQIVSNSDTVQRFNNGRVTALELMKNVNSGGISGSQSVMGFSSGRRFYYRTIPNKIAYYRQEIGNTGIINQANIRLNPWEIKSDNWMLDTDFFVGKTLPKTLSELQADLRATYVQEITFDAPYSISVNGVKLDDWSLYLEQKGLVSGGI